MRRVQARWLLARAGGVRGCTLHWHTPVVSIVLQLQGVVIMQHTVVEDGWCLQVAHDHSVQLSRLQTMLVLHTACQKRCARSTRHMQLHVIHGQWTGPALGHQAHPAGSLREDVDLRCLHAVMTLCSCHMPARPLPKCIKVLGAFWRKHTTPQRLVFHALWIR